MMTTSDVNLSLLATKLKSEIDQIDNRIALIQESINNAKSYKSAATLQETQNSACKELAAKKAEYKAVVDSFPAPTPLVLGSAKATPYPVDELPALIRDAVNAITEKVKAPVALAGQCVIGAIIFSALTRANVRDAIGQSIPINIGLLSLADSGDRKSACGRLAFQPIAEQEQMQMEQQMLDPKGPDNKGQAKELERSKGAHAIADDARTLYSDATFERIAGDFISGKSLIFWDSDEGGQVLCGHSLRGENKVAIIGGLTKLLDSGFVDRMRSRSNSESSGLAYHRRFGIHLMAQAIAVKEALNDPILRGQGLLARLLLTAPESLAGTRTLTLEELVRQSESADADPRIKRFWDRISDLLKLNDYIDLQTGNVIPPTLELTNDAKCLWLELYNETELGQNKFEKLGEVKQFAARTGDQARKLAAAFAVFKRLDHIDAECMRSAVAIVRHSIAEWSRYAQNSAVDRVSQQASALLEWLTTAERVNNWQQFTARKLQRNSFGDVRKSARKRDEILRLLCEHNYLFTVDNRVYMVNPKIVKHATG